MLPLPGLRQARRRRLLTQEQLAEQSGIGRVTINRIEHGQPARLSTIRKLSVALRVEPEELLGASEEGLEAACVSKHPRGRARARLERVGRWQCNRAVW